MNTIIIYNILEVLATFVETFICYRFINLFIRTYLSKSKCLILSGVLSIIIFFLNRETLFNLSTLAVAIIFISLTNYLIFKIPIFDSFSITAFYSFCLLFFDFFSITVLGLYFNNNAFASHVIIEQSFSRYIFLLLSKLSLIIAYILFKKLLIKQNIFKNRNLLFITIIGYVGMIYFAKLTFESINFNIAINWFLLLVIIVLLLFSVIAYMSYYKEAELKIIIILRNIILYQNYKELYKNYKKNSLIYHDTKNHLIVLDNLLQNQKYDQVRLFVKELTDRTLNNYVWTGNDIIDCIINAKKDVCEQLNIKLLVDADPINIDDLDIFLISTVIPNLLDNAIEACKKCNDEKRWLTIAVRHINKMIIIKIVNSISETPILHDNNLLTTKTEKEKHGWGIKSIEDTIQQANGAFNYYFDSQKFTTIVTIFL